MRIWFYEVFLNTQILFERCGFRFNRSFETAENSSFTILHYQEPSESDSRNNYFNAQVLDYNST